MWLVVGISGVTCSGKSTLAKSIENLLNQTCYKNEFLPNIKISEIKLVKQDSYFHHRSSPKHTWIPELNYINRDIITALDMTKMQQDLIELINCDAIFSIKNNNLNNINDIKILIIEGFLIYNDIFIRNLCSLKFDVRISYEECYKRRQKRQYNPPNPEGYFEKILWPNYLKYLDEYKNDEIIIINGEDSQDCCLHFALESIRNFIKTNF